MDGLEQGHWSYRTPWDRDATLRKGRFVGTESRTVVARLCERRLLGTGHRDK